MRAQRSAAAWIFSTRAAIAGSVADLAQHRGIADHHRQRVVELVRDAGEQRPERGQLLALVQRLARARRLGLGGAQRGQVDRGGHDRRLALEQDLPRGQRHRDLAAVGAAQRHLVVGHLAPGGELGVEPVALGRVGIERAAVEAVEVDALEPVELHVGLVDEEQLAVREPGDVHRHRVGGVDRVQPRLGGLQRRLGRLAVGDVDGEGADRADLAVGVEHREADRHRPARLGQVVGQILLAHVHLAGLDHRCGGSRSLSPTTSGGRTSVGSRPSAVSAGTPIISSIRRLNIR